MPIAGFEEGVAISLLFDGVSLEMLVLSPYEFIKEARRVELDGQKFSIKSDGTPQGFAGNQFYTFLLTPLEEGE